MPEDRKILEAYFYSRQYTRNVVEYKPKQYTLNKILKKEIKRGKRERERQ
jgi:hypothetical protein